MQNEDMTVKDVALTIFICMLFGGNTVAIKFALTGMGAFTAAGIRFAIAAVIIFLWAKYKHIPMKLKPGQFRQVCILGSIFAVQLSCFYQGLARTTASHGVLIGNLLPFFVLILAHIFIPGDTISLRKGMGITLGFIGVLFLLLDDQNLTGGLRKGDFIILFAVMLWSSSAIFVKRIIADYDPVQITFYPMVLGTPFFFIAAYFLDSRMIVNIDNTILAAIFYQSVVTAAFGFIAWNSLLQRFGATNLHSFIFIMPLAGVVFSVQLLKETVTPYLALSIGFIVSGVVVVNLRKRKQNPSSA